MVCYKLGYLKRSYYSKIIFRQLSLESIHPFQLEKGLNSADWQDCSTEKSGRSTDIYPNESCRKNQMSDVNGSKKKERCFKLPSCSDTLKGKNMEEKNSPVQMSYPKRDSFSGIMQNPELRLITLPSNGLFCLWDSHKLEQFSVNCTFMMGYAPSPLISCDEVSTYFCPLSFIISNLLL